MHQQVARHLEKEVTDEEKPCAESIRCFAEVQRIDHLQLCETHVHAVEICDHVADEQQRHESPRDAPEKRVSFGGVERVVNRTADEHGVSLSALVLEVVHK